MSTAMVSANSAWWNPGWNWKVWGMVLFLLIPTFGFALWVLSQAGGQTKIDPPTLAIARQNAGGSDITAITGTEHTVYHSNASLPEPKAHREDGKFTLAWFTTTDCKVCESELFVHSVAKEFQGQFVFMEKEVGREPAAARLGVKDVPTFLWLDSEGTEIGRFGTVADAQAFRAELEEQLGAAAGK